MKIIVDNKIVKMFVSDPEKIATHPLISDPENQLGFRWPMLLEFLGLGSLFSDIPAFDENTPIFQAAVATLCDSEEQEVLFYVYDQIFTENLHQIKALRQMHPSFLLEAIREKQESFFSLETGRVIFPALEEYKSALLEKPSDTMHDLVLYLAWDRMCVCMARVFQYPSTNAKFIHGIGVLKACLLESYQHIREQGRTLPGIYRMLEAFFFYQMREENLQNHTDAEWKMLTQSFSVLKMEEDLADFSYIDDAVGIEMEAECYLTLEVFDKVDLRLIWAQHMISRLNSEVPGFECVLNPKKIYYF